MGKKGESCVDSSYYISVLLIYNCGELMKIGALFLLKTLQNGWLQQGAVKVNCCTRKGELGAKNCQQGGQGQELCSQ